MKRKKKLLASLLALILLAALPTVGARAEGIDRTRTYTPGMFADVDQSRWYAPWVRDAYELGLMSGTGPDTFSPEAPLTLAQALTVAGRMYDRFYGGRGELPDYSGDWQSDALNYCLDNGIVPHGVYNDYTRPATRADLAAILAGALPETAWMPLSAVSAPPDVDDTTPHREAILKLYSAGVLTGTDERGTFAPHRTVTRAEAAALAARAADPALRRRSDLADVPQLTPEQTDFLQKAYTALAASDVDALEALSASDLIPDLYWQVTKPCNERNAGILADEAREKPALHAGEFCRLDFDGTRAGLGLEPPEGGLVMTLRVALDPSDSRLRSLSFSANTGPYSRTLFVTRVLQGGAMHIFTSYYKDDSLPAADLGLPEPGQVMLSRLSFRSGEGYDVSEAVYTGAVPMMGSTRVLTDGRAVFSCRTADGLTNSGYAQVADSRTVALSNLTVTAVPDQDTGLTVHTVWLRCGPDRWSLFRTPDPAPADGFTNALWYRQFPFAVWIEGPGWQLSPDLRYEVSLG